MIKDLQVEADLLQQPQHIQLVKNLVFHTHTKHIEVHYHFMCEHVLIGEFKLRYVRTNRQVVHIFTKPLGLNKVRHFSKMLGLEHLDMPHLRARPKEVDKGRT